MITNFLANNIILGILMFIFAFCGFAYILSKLTQSKTNPVRLPPISITNKELLELKYQHRAVNKPNGDMNQMVDEEIAAIIDEDLHELPIQTKFERERFIKKHHK